MRRCGFLGQSLVSLLCAVVPVSAPAAADEVDAQPTIAKLQLTAGVLREGRVMLVGRDAAAQLLATANDAAGRTFDATRSVQYEASPDGIVEVSPDGWVTPTSEGEAVIRAKANGHQAEVQVAVSRLVEDAPMNFAGDVVPIFTRYGCNSGGCHGKSGGQNGFRLSLLGFEPGEDYQYIVQEARGRRVFPAAPAASLLLQKASGQVPHGGGARFDVDSPPYRILRRWIAQQMPLGSPDDPVVSHIEVLPRERQMTGGESQQLAVVAHFTDGSKRDVTRTAQLEANDEEMAAVSPTGLVTAGDLAGSVAIMARYQSQVDVFRVTVPLGAPVDNMPAPANFIDELVFKKLRQLGLPPSPPSDDATFLRRTTIDIAGRLPTKEEAEAFLADGDANKRQRLIERLLESADYADYFANKWSAILRNRRANGENKTATYAFHNWIRESLLDNKPYDQFVREIIAASGEAGRNPPVTWYHQVRDPSAQVEDVAQLFLGVRIGCARCHHHPFEKWSQDDYYGLSAFFSRVGRKASPLGNAREHVFHNRGQAAAQNPKTGGNLKPTALDAEPLELAAEVDPRGRLADWMAKPDNPFFARALVNRYWKHFFGRGLVDPEDDMRVTNPATHPELLDALAGHFVQSGFDLNDLVRTICNSQVYGLAAEPNEYNQSDRQNHSRFYPRRLSAEVLLDSIDALTQSPSRFGGVPAGTRAVELPDNAFDSFFLTVFGRPDSASACECERSSDANLAQCLHLLNSPEIQAKIGGRRAQQFAGKKESHEEHIRELYLVAFSREPTADETSTAAEYLDRKNDDPKAAYEDLIWALINTKEFLFNH